ncbi:MAG: hypothetical protein WCV00_20325 [Verrucomicrobiia bacterium]|jgi:hypothetical protein
MTEWINACKTGGPTTCNFDYSGALAETVLLGNVAYRTGERLTWDSQLLRPVNCPKADHFIQHQYRKGWRIGGDAKTARLSAKEPSVMRP